MNTIKTLISAVAIMCCSVIVYAQNAKPGDIAPGRICFAWGADINGSVDLSEHDMSSLGIEAMFGIEYRWIRFLGIGAQADVMVSNSSRSFPLTLNFRTDFSSSRRRLLFMDIRGGIALNYLNGDRNETDLYVSGGIGVTLAHKSTYSSHFIIGYTYLGQKQCYYGERLRDCPGISYATIRFGVTF